MQEEIAAFEENEAWQLVEVPDHATVVKCKWVFKRKFEVSGSVRYRARLVAKGFSQKPGVDYFETFSPVVRFSTLRLLVALSVKLKLEACHLDVSTAFLNGKLKEKVFMSIPEGMKVSNKNKKVLLLNRAVYGLKQASRTWYERVELFFAHLGYVKCKLEPCLFIKSQKDILVIIALYVDDFFIFSNNVQEANLVKTRLSTEFKIKDLGQLKHCLGMSVNCDKTNNVVTMDQIQYIDQVLKRFNMLDCKPVTTPIEPGLKLEKGNGFARDVPYQQLIGSLMYLSVLTRPDISCAVSYLSQFNNCYNDIHWRCAKRILRYLQGTKSYGLRFTSNGLLNLEYLQTENMPADILTKSFATGKHSNGLSMLGVVRVR